MPTYAETKEILESFRSANSDGQKMKVIKQIRKSHPDIAARLTKLVEEERRQC